MTEQSKTHNHIDSNNDGKCDVCQVELCETQKQEGARNLMCTRIKTHKGQHYDRKAKVHF